MKHIAVIASLALAACSPASDADTADTADTEAAATPSTPAATATPQPQADSGNARTLRLEGLGDLVIGKPVPAGSSFASRGAQIPGTDCRTISSPDFPGVYAITTGGEVRRITVGDDSDVTLVEGLGAGASEADVRAAFPSFRETPHKYVDAPAKYLVQPGNDPRLRFEIDRDGKVNLIHVGLMPELGYVEGCA